MTAGYPPIGTLESFESALRWQAECRGQPPPDDAEIAAAFERVRAEHHRLQVDRQRRDQRLVDDDVGVDGTEVGLIDGGEFILGPRGGDVLDDVRTFLTRFVAFPSAAAADATILWAAHAHVIDSFESTPRLALLSPEKGSGKTRTLEVLELLVPKPMHAVNCTAAALFRAVSAGRPTLLFDEADTYFGPRVAQHHEELRALINAGHRRGAVAYRCVGEPAKMEVKEFPAYAAVALAGIGDVPDTILDRAVLVRMRRRAPDEPVEPFRRRQAEGVGTDLRKRLAAWTKAIADDLAEATPEMPTGITDRPADVWEPLIAIADAAGGEWPARARAAAVELNAARAAADPSLGVQLLADVRRVFEESAADRLGSETLAKALCELEESPWADLKGKALDARGLARRLRRFEVRPKTIRIGDTTPRGYERGDFVDAWNRYLPTPVSDLQETATTATSTTPQVMTLDDVAVEEELTATPATESQQDSTP